MANYESLFFVNLSAFCLIGLAETALDGETSDQTAICHKPTTTKFGLFGVSDTPWAYSVWIILWANITEALQNLYDVIKREINARSLPIVEQETEVSPGSGHPKIVIEKKKLKKMLDTHLPVSCIAKVFSVSRRTIYIRIQEFGCKRIIQHRDWPRAWQHDFSH